MGALGAALAFIAAGCGGHHHAAAPALRRAATTTATTSTTAPPPRVVPANLDTSASLSFALPSAPSNWNPLSAGGAGQATALVAAGVLPSVFRTQPDGTLAMDADFVASAVETHQKPQTIVYRLNPKATWSDGISITAADFVYTWKAQSGRASFRDIGGVPFTPASTLGYNRITSVTPTAGDPETVTVTFSAPYTRWQNLFGPILPAHIAQAVGFNQGFTNPVDDVVSGGPFLVQSEVPGRSLTLVRNARYWASPASLSSVTLEFAGASVVGGALLQGQLGAALFGLSDLPTSDGLVAELRAVAGLKLDESPSAVWEDLEFSPGSSVLANAALRQAIVAAVDRSSLIAATAGTVAGVVPLGNRFFLPQVPGYVDNTGGQHLHADLAGAQADLNRAGYTDRDGVLRKGTRPVALNLFVGVDDALHRTEETVLASDLAPLGIAVHATVVSNLTQRLADDDYDLAIVDRVAGATPGAVSLPALVGTLGLATTREVATLVGRADAAATVEAQDAAYNTLDQLLWLHAVDLPLFQVPSVLAYQSRYANLTNVAFAAGIGYNIAEWGVPDRS